MRNLKEKIKKSLKHGLEFLSKEQLPSGEFPMTRWNRNNKKEVSYVKTVFLTPFILHSLLHIKKYANVEKICDLALNFLIREMEQNGLWRFFGKKSYIHFDLDTTCCTLAALKEYNIEMDYQLIATQLLTYRNMNGIFNTWILDIDPPFKKEDNIIDWVVNANVLYFYSLLNYDLTGVEKYLKEVVETEKFMQRSPYYDSPFCFAYCLTRIYSNGCNSRLKDSINKINAFLNNIDFENECQISSLDYVFLTAGKFNCNENFNNIEESIKFLLNMQNRDGGWPIDIFFTEGPYTNYSIVYGSRLLTTAITLEVICKYIRIEKWDLKI